MAALVDFWLCWSHKFSVEGRKSHKWHTKTFKSSPDVFIQICPYCSQWSLYWNSRSTVFYPWPNHLWAFRWRCRTPLQVRYGHVTDRCSRSPSGWRASTEWGSFLRTAANRGEESDIMHETTCIISLSGQQKSAIFHLELQLVEKRLPVQTKVTLRWVELVSVREGHHAGAPALRRDFSTDGQRALIGWDCDAITARGDVDTESAWAAAVAPGATKLEIPIIFTGGWRTQTQIRHRLSQVWCRITGIWNKIYNLLPLKKTQHLISNKKHKKATETVGRAAGTSKNEASLQKMSNTTGNWNSSREEKVVLGDMQ